MASKTMELANLASIVLILILPLPTLAQFDECRNESEGLLSCSAYIENRDEFPPPDCCYSLEDVAQSQPDCLCQVLRGNEDVNTTRFSQLPTLCGVRTPSFHNCYYDDAPPFFSGYSIKLLNSLLLYALTAASCAHIFRNA